MSQREDWRGSLDVQRVHRATGPGSAGSLLPEFINIGIVEAQVRYKYKPHRENRFQVILVERGTYRCGLNETWLTLVPGQGLFVQPGDLHEDLCEPPLRYLGINFQLRHAAFGNRSPRLFAEGVSAKDQCFTAPAASFQPLIAALSREAAQSDPLSAPMQDALLLQLFWSIIRRLRPEVLSPEFVEQSLDSSLATRLARFFSAHAETDLSVAQMAKRLHMSQRTLTDRCRKALGMSPAQAFLVCRLSRAGELLTRTELSLSEISDKLAFSSPFNLSRAFKRHFGVSPSHWRQREQAKNR